MKIFKSLLLSVFVSLFGSVLVFAQSPLPPLPELPQYDMSGANSFVWSLLNWSPVYWFVLAAFAIGLFAMILGAMKR